MSESTNNTAKIIGAALLGAAIGGLIGVLFAPDKGSKTRKRLMNKGHELSDTMKQKFSDLMSDMKKEAAEGAEKVKDTAKDFKDTLKDEAKNFNGKPSEDRQRATQPL